jgi:hypothetical protein
VNTVHLTAEILLDRRADFLVNRSVFLLTDNLTAGTLQHLLHCFV